MPIEVREHTLAVSATAANLPPDVAEALSNPVAGELARVTAGATTWATTTWGDPSDAPLLLVHGLTADSAIYWRLAPALAAARRHVVAVDLPGHGFTAQWQGRHRFADTAADLASFVAEAGLAQHDLAVVGHSWGGMIVAGLPAAGVKPRTLVLLDPPHLTHDELEPLAHSATEQPYDSIDAARQAIRDEYPGWSTGDVEAKATALTRFDRDAALSIYLENGDWDAGLAALAAPAAADVDVWYIRGELETGGLIPEIALPALAARVGADHVLTIAGGPHSPMRTHPEATTLAILAAVEGSPPRGSR